MRIGYIHADWGEQSKVQQVLLALREPGAIDELGIGRIRDAFADRMFPGISTLQKRVKYFSLMPQLYLKVIDNLVKNKVHVGENDVAREIVSLEKILTQRLIDDTTICDNEKYGITGSDQIKNGKFVKYDPAYIYNSGLYTYNIIGLQGKNVGGNLRRIIAAIVNARIEQPQRYETENETVSNDDDVKSGLLQYIRNPGVDYDFTYKCSIAPTPEDKKFIIDSILGAEACCGTLLHFLVENIGSFDFAQCEFAAIVDIINATGKTLPNELVDIHSRAARFSYLVYILYLRYNYILSQNNQCDADEEVLGMFNDELAKYKAKYGSSNSIGDILDGLLPSGDHAVLFCENAEETLLKGDFKELDTLIIKREERKGSRKKIGSAFEYKSNNRVHFYKLDYRWGTLRGFINELKQK